MERLAAVMCSRSQNRGGEVKARPLETCQKQRARKKYRSKSKAIKTKIQAFSLRDHDYISQERNDTWQRHKERQCFSRASLLSRSITEAFFRFEVSIQASFMLLASLLSGFCGIILSNMETYPDLNEKIT